MFIERTPIQRLNDLGGNRLYIKREDLIPFSFGGNKARKAALFFREMDEGGYNAVVTYGSSSSNHCRVVANLCAQRGIPCRIVMPREESHPTFNSRMTGLFGAETVTVPVDMVHDTLEAQVAELAKAGFKPYFIPGGGHGNLGTQAYVECYDEIRAWEAENGIHFDYIFHASGTGTTQAGLAAGQLLRGDERAIVGISIARKNPRGRNIVLESLKDYLGKDVPIPEEKVIFIDDYARGYAKADDAVRETVKRCLKEYGIPMDEVYVGKAFHGMEDYLTSRGIAGKNVLFIHTGGTPLFFDTLKEMEE